MPKIVAQITPQRSTQYTDLARALAPHEITLSRVNAHIVDDLEPVRLGTHDYLKFAVDHELDETMLQTLADFAMTDAYFAYYDQIGEVAGPLLKPIDIASDPFLPGSLVATRRYRGKTNELFTQWMVNIARFSSDYHATPWNKLTLLDPLAGGGTTLFVGLVFGADVVGVEHDRSVVDGTVAFLKQYMKEARISAKFRTDNLKSVGRRSFITIKKSVRCVVGHGITRDVAHFVNGLKRPQLIVTDLPYGIQHVAEWKSMLLSALPAWATVLDAGGALVFSWNATQFSRPEMIELVQDVSDFTVLNAPPYDGFSHSVDRVIKRRDVIVARL